MSVYKSATNHMLLKVLNMLTILTAKAAWLYDLDKEKVWYLPGRIGSKPDGCTM
jgi:hypothetical protein